MMCPGMSCSYWWHGGSLSRQLSSGYINTDVQSICHSHSIFALLNLSKPNNERSWISSSSSSSSSVTQLFEAWLNKHGKTYLSEKRNNVNSKSLKTTTISSSNTTLNSFADLTHHEFKASHLGLAAVLTSSARRNVGEPREVRDITDSIDWNQEGAVTDVKDQGSCGIDFLSSW